MRAGHFFYAIVLALTSGFLVIAVCQKSIGPGWLGTAVTLGLLVLVVIGNDIADAIRSKK